MQVQLPPSYEIANIVRDLGQPSEEDVVEAVEEANPGLGHFYSRGAVLSAREKGAVRSEGDTWYATEGRTH
ncbi:hypothetical protein CMO91_00515 [Candidatus Woesearchaeota archaeon]|nr:hypothetical protein [Candidatus Woesearchaeota archaeon]|tara:strand:- start:491 stop:703 length:213 start_codon:yes stop_codon:yes gene_type:complete